MNSYFVLTAVGPDRPGLVDEISEFLAARKINIEDSRMAVLGGEFAVILLASGETEPGDAFGRELKLIERSTGLSITLRPTRSPHERSMEPSMPHRLTATSMDHPGIVHEVTSILHRKKINIESMETRVSNAPQSGSPIFKMKCIINIPAGEKLSSLRREMEELADRMDIDIDLDAAD
jgi:glycine cleavage system transcriptional repressor